MADMYGNYDSSKNIECTELNVMKALSAINIGFAFEAERRGSADPAFGAASAYYLHKVFGSEMVLEIIKSPKAYALAFNLCAVVAGLNTTDGPDFRDLMAEIHNVAKEHPEMVRLLDSKDIDEVME